MIGRLKSFGAFLGWWAFMAVLTGFGSYYLIPAASNHAMAINAAFYLGLGVGFLGGGFMWSLSTEPAPTTIFQGKTAQTIKSLTVPFWFLFFTFAYAFVTGFQRDSLGVSIFMAGFTTLITWSLLEMRALRGRAIIVAEQRLRLAKELRVAVAALAEQDSTDPKNVAHFLAHYPLEIFDAMISQKGWWAKNFQHSGAVFQRLFRETIEILVENGLEVGHGYEMALRGMAALNADTIDVEAAKIAVENINHQIAARS